MAGTPTLPYREALAELMRDHEVSCSALADWIGLSNGHLCNTLRGNKPVPGDAILERIAVCFRVRPDVFLEYRERHVRAHKPVALARAVDRIYNRLAAA